MKHKLILLKKNFSNHRESQNKYCVCSFQTFRRTPVVIPWKWKISMCTVTSMWKCDFWNNKTSKQCRFLGNRIVNLHWVANNNRNMLPYNATKNSNTTTASKITASLAQKRYSLASVCIFTIDFASCHIRLDYFTQYLQAYNTAQEPGTMLGLILTPLWPTFGAWPDLKYFCYHCMGFFNLWPWEQTRIRPDVRKHKLLV